MGRSNPAEWSIRLIRLPNPIAINTLIGAFVLTSTSVFAEDNFLSTYYRVADEARPQVGVVLDSKTFKETGYNFKSCDGEVSFIAFERLKPTQQSCEKSKKGLFYFTARSDELGTNRAAIPLYGSDYNAIGVITGVTTKSHNGEKYLLANIERKFFPTDLVDAWENLNAFAPMTPTESAETEQVAIPLDSNFFAVATTPEGKEEIILRNLEGFEKLARTWVDQNGCRNLVTSGSFHIILESAYGSNNEEHCN